MYYENTLSGRFISRPNRFVAHCEVDGDVYVCHVKNTGRCKELLTDGAHVILQKAKDPDRRTQYSLISVYKGDKLINMDSQAPNKVFCEYIPSLFPDATYVKSEYRYGASRLDYYIECGARKLFVEVKGVTLEQDGICLFPDAPTDRGIKHLSELSRAISEGYEAYAVFVIQLDGVKHFSPNKANDPEFFCSLKAAQKAGVKVLAFECAVTEDSLHITKEVPVILE